MSIFVVLLAKAYTSSPSQIEVKRTSEDPHQLQKKFPWFASSMPSSFNPFHCCGKNLTFLECEKKGCVN
jgi:hypothetical protein